MDQLGPVVALTNQDINDRTPDNYPCIHCITCM